MVCLQMQRVLLTLLLIIMLCKSMLQGMLFQLSNAVNAGAGGRYNCVCVYPACNIDVCCCYRCWCCVVCMLLVLLLRSCPRCSMLMLSIIAGQATNFVLQQAKMLQSVVGRRVNYHICSPLIKL